MIGILIWIYKAGSAQNPILSSKAVQSLFEGALTETGVKNITWLSSAVDPTAPADPMQWSTGLAICETDWPGRRRKGSAYCEYNVTFKLLNMSYVLIFRGRMGQS